jgi:hypothetical protein
LSWLVFRLHSVFAVGVFEHKIQVQQPTPENIFLGIFPKSHDCDVQRVQLIHLGNGPCPPLAVPPHEGALVAGLAQGHAGVLAVLLNMVGVTGAGGVTDTARQLLDQRQMTPLGSVDLVVH